MAKLLDELKAERTKIERHFSHLAKDIKKNHEEMDEEELRENFQKLTLESSRVLKANDEVELAYLAECKAAAAEELSNPQKADIEKTEKECQKMTDEVKSLIRDTLWATYGAKELSLALQIAEDECENFSYTQPDTTLEEYEFMLTHLKDLVSSAKEVHHNWKRWAPPGKKGDFECRLRRLQFLVPKFVSRKAGLIKAASIKTTQALQKQGEPIGSKEVKKFQLLDSL